MGTTGAMVGKRAGIVVLCALASWAGLSAPAFAAGGASATPSTEASATTGGGEAKLSKGAPTQRVNLMVQDRGASTVSSKDKELESSHIGLGAGFFMEDSEQRDEQLRGGQQTRDQEPRDWESASVYNIQAWYLRTIFTPGLRWGAGLTWYNAYSLEDPESDNEDEEPFVVGQLFQVGLQAEYEIQRIVSDLGLVIGLRGGGSLLFSSKDLRGQIEGLERRGFDVWGGPSPGVYVAPLAGVRWPLTQRISLRADLSAQFSKLWLYSAEGEAAGITSEENSQLNTTRTQVLIGLDFGL
jgi:hypothetical protein